MTRERETGTIHLLWDCNPMLGKHQKYFKGVPLEINQSSTAADESETAKICRWPVAFPTLFSIRKLFADQLLRTNKLNVPTQGFVYPPFRFSACPASSQWSRKLFGLPH